MKVIYKYPLILGGTQYINISPRHTILCVKLQNNDMVLYAEVEPTIEANIELPIYIHGTGSYLPSFPMDYIDTLMTMEDQLVWHIYKGV